MALPFSLLNYKKFMRFSIIIPNYNYGDFVGAAIESALALDWPNVEVIVVDDGSTDHSRAVIETFGDKVKAIFQENATQRVACNRGFAESTGDWVIFLDSDDLLAPSIPREVAKVAAPGVSKVQFQMMRIDARGKPLNSVFPAYKPMPTPEKIREWAVQTSGHPTPPGSGNVYPRWFLERLFPLDDSCGSFSDSACIAAAPFVGDVLTIPIPLVSYRIHDRNDSRVADDSRFAREIRRAQARLKFARRYYLNGPVLHNNLIFNSLEVLQFRAASVKLQPADHPLEGDGWGRIFSDAFRVPIISTASSIKVRALVWGWVLVTLFSPTFLARKVIAFRYK